MSRNKVEVSMYVTDEYELFTRLKGNRAVTNKRIAIIKASIEQVGYISNPIIVNEKYEIIDGQGRFEVLRMLNMPIEYRIINGIGIEECRAMNLKPTSWTLQDFIESYAEFGDKDERYAAYVLLKKMHEEYGFGYQLLYSIVNNRTISGRGPQQDIRDGSFKITNEEYVHACDICEYLKGFNDIQKRIGGRAEAFYGCVAWCSQRPGIDKDRLRVAIHQQVNSISPVAKTEPTLREFSAVYNKGYSRKKQRDFVYEWRFEN